MLTASQQPSLVFGAKLRGAIQLWNEAGTSLGRRRSRRKPNTEQADGDRCEARTRRLSDQESLRPGHTGQAGRRSEAEKKKLDHVREATRAEIDRYRNYGSAEEVVTNFKRDLHSSAAKKVHNELKSLHLPTLDDIRDEFEEKARDLGVN